MKAAVSSSSHAEGLLRFTRIIDANPNYHEILNRRTPDPELEFFDSDAGLPEKAERAIEVCRTSLSKSPIRLIEPRTEIAYYGNTENNLREFRFISSLCELPFSQAQNYRKAANTSVRRDEDADELISRMNDDIAAFYRARAAIHQPLVRQQILYSRSYLSYRLSFRSRDAVLPKLFILANDHSPVHVALSMVMKDLDIPRIYVQHAEVSETFPPLDFEISVLRNQVSLDTYRKIGQIGGNAFVVAREDAPLDDARLRQRREAPIRVVVYPTARVIPDALNGLVARLRTNPGVAGVAIKPHPASSPPLEEVLAEPVEMLSAIPEADHVAIVGNSSIVVELLRRGLPVYQNFDFDPIVRDYYGFVARGLAKEARGEDLAGEFWTPYRLDETWWAEYRRLDPAGSPDQADVAKRLRARVRALVPAPAALPPPPAAPPQPAPGTDQDDAGFLGYLRRKARKKKMKLQRRMKALRKKLRSAFRPWTGAAVAVTSPPTAAPGVQKQGPVSADVLWTAMCEADDLPLWLERNTGTGAADSLAVIAILEKHFAARDPRIVGFFARHEWFPVRSLVGAWIAMKSVEWSKGTVTVAQLDDLFDAVTAPDVAPALRTRLLSLLMSRTLSQGTLAQIMRCHAAASQGGRPSLSLSNQIALLRRLAAEASPGEYAEFRATLEDAWSPLDRLKVESAEALSGHAVAGWSHEEAIRRLAAAAPATVVRDLEDVVFPVYRAFDPGRLYMDVRVDSGQKDALVERIGRALAFREPFSLVRLSDGEGYLFADPGYFFTPRDVANRELHWWGRTLDERMRAEVRTHALAAVREADVVGIPSVFRFVRDCSARSPSLLSTLQGRGLIEVLSHAGASVRTDALVTEDKVNVALFSDPDMVVRLAAEARAVLLVSSVKQDFLPGQLRDLADLRTIEVPTHHRTLANPAFQDATEALPFVADDIHRSVEVASGPGALVLVSAGIAGKRFLKAARDAGAVALDLGNVLDDWVSEGTATFR